MKAFVLAAGLGTRLRPFTLEHPKALVAVGGMPMLEHVLGRLRAQGFDEVTINLHHFGEQIVEYVASRVGDGLEIRFSDESEMLLETGGAILKAKPLLGADNEPFLVHNADILSDAPLSEIMEVHKAHGNDVTLLVSDRDSSRKLIFGNDGRLRGWHHLTENRFKPESYSPADDADSCIELAFSGIYVMSQTIYAEMERQGRNGRFSVVDFLLDAIGKLRIEAFTAKSLHLIDIGKPATLSQADRFLADLNRES